jgi:hypothetical protein
MQRVRIVSNRTEAQGTLVDLLNPQPLSHHSFDHAESYALAIPHNQILEPSTIRRGHRTMLQSSICYPGLAHARRAYK